MLNCQIKAGSLVTEGTSDVLTLALGTPEHPGRVRGKGHGVTPTTFFNLTKRGSKKHISELESKLHAEREIGKEKDVRMQELLAKVSEYERAMTKVGLNTPKSGNGLHKIISSNVTASCDSRAKKTNKKKNSNVRNKYYILLVLTFYFLYYINVIDLSFYFYFLRINS